MTNKMNCTSCGHREAEIIQINEHLAYYNCIFCGHCELVTASTQREAFELAQEKYFGQNLQSLESVKEDQQTEINNFRMDIVNRRLSPSSSIVEVGPGLGFFAKRLVMEGHCVTLVEHSPAMADLLSKQTNFTVHTGELETSSLDVCSFDVFCSFHVIEHVVNPAMHLLTGFNIVRPGGIAFIATPNARSWQQGLFPTLSPNFDSAHLRVYSPMSLQKLCKEVGWEVVEVHTPEYLPGWLRVVTKFLRRVKNEDEEATAGKYAGNMSVSLSYLLKLIGFVTLPLRALQRRTGGGNELFLVLRKPNNRK